MQGVATVPHRWVDLKELSRGYNAIRAIGEMKTDGTSNDYEGLGGQFFFKFVYELGCHSMSEKKTTVKSNIMNSYVKHKH